MSGTDSAQHRALLLRSVDFGDRDRIVTLLTRDGGKVSAMARGARGSRRRFVGLEPLCVLDVELLPGRGELQRLQGCALRRGYPGVLRSLEAISEGGRAIELLRSVTVPEHPEPELFDLVESFFEALERWVLDPEAAAEPTRGSGLDAGRAGVEPPAGEVAGAATAGARPRAGRLCALSSELRARVVAILGLLPELDACLHCGREAPPARAVLYASADDGVVCRACGGGEVLLSAAARGLLAALAGARPFADAAWTDPGVRGVDELVSALLGRHVRAPTARAPGGRGGRPR